MKLILKSIITPAAAFFVAATLSAQPKPKSPKEVEALQKVQAAQNDPDAQIQAIDYVLENFADTDFKSMLLGMATDDAQRKGDFEKTIVYGERTLQADPNNIPVRVTLADTIATHIRENDLDKDQNLKKVDDYATKALDLLKTQTAPPAGFPADQWPDYKKELTARAHAALGQAAEDKKKYDDAVTHYKTALSEDSKPNPIIMARLSKAYNENKQYDDAASTADKVLASPDATPQVKEFAQQQKDAAAKLKTAK